ncbi:MAG: beta-ketoacyl-ACP synthase III [Aureispira sp.]|nr:beta-ketoacyl-ACP synthase III [Aureispira sp.]
MSFKPIKIVSMGQYLPVQKVDSASLEKELGLEEGWILKTNGVRSRHYVNAQETGAYMGAQALQKALNRANMQFEDLDLLIDASGSFDFPIPHNACLIPRELGILNAGIPCWDVDSTCLGFVTALDMASYLLDGSRYSNVAIVNSEIASKSLNPKDPKSATLFVDAAIATIVSYCSTDEGKGVLAAGMETYSQGAHYTRVKGGGNALHPNTKTTFSDFTFAMEGKAVMRLGMQKILPFVEKLFSTVELEMSDIDCIIPHQASKMALDFAQKVFKWRSDQMVSILADYGNCISTSIPLALYTAIESGQLQRGDSCLLLGTAAGLSVGGLVFVY